MSHYCDCPRPCAMHETNRGNYDVTTKAVAPTPKAFDPDTIKKPRKYGDAAAPADQDIMVKIPADLVPKLKEMAAAVRESCGVHPYGDIEDLIFVHHMALSKGIEVLLKGKS